MPCFKSAQVDVDGDNEHNKVNDDSALNNVDASYAESGIQVRLRSYIRQVTI